MKKRKKQKPPLDPVAHLVLATRPLLELFAALDDVFSENGALLKPRSHKTAWQCYRAWKHARTHLDPDFDSNRWRQQRAAVRKGITPPE